MSHVKILTRGPLRGGQGRGCTADFPTFTALVDLMGSRFHLRGVRLMATDTAPLMEMLPMRSCPDRVVLRSVEAREGFDAEALADFSLPISRSHVLHRACAA